MVIRLIFVLLILASFGMAIASVDEREDQVKGVKDENRVLSEEIDRTLKVVAMRPDYAAAWIKLSVLYEQVGDSENAKRALENAKRLNPDL